MFPLIAIAGVIGAVMSVANGASWVSDQLDSTKGTAAVGGKGGTKPQIDAKASAFADALAAQVAGQSMPASLAVAPMATGLLPPQHGTDYDAMARMKAGFVSYSHIGERRDDHDKQPPGVGNGPGATS